MSRPPHRPRRWSAVLLLVLVAACDGDAAPPMSTTSSTPPATTTPPAPATSGAAPSSAPRTTGPDLTRLLEDPTMTGEHQLAPHVPLYTYADAAAAAADDRSSPWELSLDGTWLLALADRPADVPVGFWSVDADTSGWRQVEVPHTWQSDGLDHPIFRNIATEMVPDDPPHPPRDVNPTGAYVRDIDVPDTWSGDRRTIIRFDGVTSAWALWLNGQYVGADQGGALPAEFDVTDVVHPGTNRVAVQVHRWSAGSYLEDYDQWRSSGIFRSVTMRSVPSVRIDDVTIRTDLDDSSTDATLSVAVDVSSSAAGAAPLRVVGRLWPPGGGDAGPVAELVGDIQVSPTNATSVELEAVVDTTALWSPDAPTLYALTLDLVDGAGNPIHSVRQAVGFREIEVVDEQLRLNGDRLVVRGVNRTDADPDTGRHQSAARLEQDLLAMKRLNINAIRTAHAPSDPLLYDLADELGILVLDEVEIETHNHQTCPNDCLADRPEWEPAMLDRYRGMVERDKNHPSVFMWSTGNEAGLGRAHVAMADWSQRRDPTRPLVHQSNEPNGDAPYAAVSAPRYLSPSALAAADAASTKPIVMGEYAHAQGNGLGNFVQWWDVVRSGRRAQGGFVWDWADQDLRAPFVTTPDRSPHDVVAMLSGLPAIVPGRSGQAVSFSGLDDTVEIARHPALDITGTQLTIDAVVRAVEPSPGGFPILSKGDQYVLGATPDGRLELAITSGGQRVAAQAPLPSDWAGTWHRVTGTYDGSALRIYVDGAALAEQPWSEPIDASGRHLALGRNTATMAELYGGRTGAGAVDQVRVYDIGLDATTIARGDDPVDRAVLALDLDTFEEDGSYLSYGLYESGDDGLVSADRVPQPETAELAWVLAPVRVRDVDARAGVVAIDNERPALDTSDLQALWRVTEGDRVLESGVASLEVEPGSSAQVVLPVTTAIDDGAERFLLVEIVTRTATPWADSGHRVSFGQFPIGGSTAPDPQGAPAADPGPRPTVVDGPDGVEVRSGDVVARIDRRTGTLASFSTGGVERLRSGPVLDAWRAPISNETSTWGLDEATLWRAVGLDRLTTQVSGIDVAQGADTVDVVVRSVVAAPGVVDAGFEQSMTFSFDGSSAVRITHSIVPTGRLRDLPYLPRLGMQLAVPDTFSALSWYGRGPGENYRDRQLGSPIGVYTSSVDEQFVDYQRPQDNANHTDVRWIELRDGDRGLLAVADGPPIEAGVSSFDALDRAPVGELLERTDGWTTVHLDAVVSGVGETPNSVQPAYAVSADAPVEYTVTLRAT